MRSVNTHMCVCVWECVWRQVPFHAQIECLSGLVGTSLAPAPAPSPETETPHGNVYALFAVASLSRLSIHLLAVRLDSLETPTQTGFSTFHILAISESCIRAYNSCRFQCKYNRKLLFIVSEEFRCRFVIRRGGRK